MTGKQLLDKLSNIGSVEHAFRFPYAYIRCISAEFEGKEVNGATVAFGGAVHVFKRRKLGAVQAQSLLPGPRRMN